MSVLRAIVTSTKTSKETLPSSSDDGDNKFTLPVQLSVWIGFGWYGVGICVGFYIRILMESLILAQDERLRRA